MMLRLQQPLVGVYPGLGGGEEHTPPIPVGDYRFPNMYIDQLGEIDAIMKPFCDQAHQMFGREGSPNFDDEGHWILV
jgi:hypothetical protein